VLNVIEASKEADLEAKSKEDKVLESLVWSKPQFENIYDHHSRIFRRIAQLCDKE